MAVYLTFIGSLKVYIRY